MGNKGMKRNLKKKETGWECPKCGSVLAPWMVECPHCKNSQIKVPEGLEKWNRNPEY